MKALLLKGLVCTAEAGLGPIFDHRSGRGALIPQAHWLNLLAVVYGAMIPYTAMAYDQRGRWDRFARMLPYSDRTVVLSRYALGWISLSVGAAAVAMLAKVCSPVSRSVGKAVRQPLPPAIVFAALCVGCLLLDLNIPLILRLRHRKGPAGLCTHYVSSPLPPQALSAGWQTSRAPLPLC